MGLRVGEISFDLSLATGKFGSQLNAARTQLQNFNRNAGSGLKGVGDQADVAGKKVNNLTGAFRMLQPAMLAIAGIGFAKSATNMAMSYESSLSRIVGLVGVSRAELDEMTQGMAQLAAQSGKTAGEAAEALFFITSAGLRGADAMNVLEASMKASAIGLGDTKTIADLSTSAMNAYGASVLSASGATDVLVATVREGKLEASELAGSMGRVLPIASALGVSFNEVGAAFASLSRTGTNAAEAATQLRGILASILKPSSDANKALAEMGLSASGLRQQLADEGLLSVLQTLALRFGDNEEAAGRVFGNIRALSGVMDLMGANAATTDQIFKNMNDTVGDGEKAFEEFSQTAEFKMSKAMSETKNALLELGTALLPLITMFADSVSAIASVANSNKELTGIILKVAAAFGGLLLAGKAWRMFSGSLITSNAALAASTTTLTGAIGANFSAMIAGAGKAARALGVLQVAVAGVQTAMNTGRTADAVTATGGSYLEGFATQYVSFLNSLTFGLTPLNDALNDFYASAETIRLAESGQLITRDMSSAADAISDASKEMDSFGKTAKLSLDDARKRVESFLNSVRSTKEEILSSKSIFGVPDQETNISEADKNVRDAQRKLSDARADLARTRRDYREGSRQLLEARRAVADAQSGLADAQKAADEARGLSSGELLSRAERNRKIQEQLRQDLFAIKEAGFSDQALLGLAELENEAPGTIRRLVEEGITKPYVDSLNKSFEAYDSIADMIAYQLEFARKNLNDAYEGLGESNGQSYLRGLENSIKPPVINPQKLNQKELDAFSAAGFNMDPNTVYGINYARGAEGSSKPSIMIQNQTVVANDPNEFRRAMDSESRRSSLEGRSR